MADIVDCIYEFEDYHNDNVPDLIDIPKVTGVAVGGSDGENKGKCQTEGAVSCFNSLPSFKESPIAYMPDEILLKILGYCSQLESTFSFYNRISLVCRRWYRLSTDIQLWSRVYLSQRTVLKTRQTWQDLCGNWFYKLQTLTVHGWAHLDLKLLVECSPKIKKLDISFCGLSTTCYQALTEFEHLTELQLSCMINRTVAVEDECLMLSSVLRILKERGHGLHVFNISGNTISMSTYESILSSIECNCHSLTELDLRHELPRAVVGCNVLQFPVNTLQANCPRMRSLRLPGCLTLICKSPDQDESNGFPHLQEFVVGSALGGIRELTGPIDNMLTRILSKSPDLKVLNFNNCNRVLIKGHSTWSLVFPKLSSLSISNTVVPIRCEHFNIFVRNHQATIVELDMSYCSTYLDSTVRAIVGQHQPSPIRSWDLSNSTVTVDDVLNILHGCHYVEKLNLSKCTKLRCCAQHYFQSPVEMSMLYHILEIF